MNKIARSLLFLLAILVMTGCATKQAPLPPFSAQEYDMKEYASRVDHFLILFDASRSLEMNQTFGEARAVVERMNANIPELGQTAGLRSFGHDPSVSRNTTELFYGMEKYSRAKLAAGFAKIHKAGGFSPINEGLDAAGKDLKGLAGRKAIILISDGEDLPEDVLIAAKRLKAMYGNEICFYTIHIGDSVAGKDLLTKIAEIGGCGFIEDGRSILTTGGMYQFVQKVFLYKKGTPRAPKITMIGDADGDGVKDDKDKCPGTPAGAYVNRAGCWVLSPLLFDYDKSEIRAVGQPTLNSVAMVLEQNPGMTVEVAGHCDNIGSAAYNKGLSQRRANAVKNYLVKEGIASSRIKAKGYGFDKPVASNATPGGRAKNRRVEITPKK